MFDQNFPQRKSPRLQGYDYSQEGVYFVTVCTHKRISLLAKIEDQILVLNAIGRMIDEWWQKLPRKFPDIWLDCHVVMPNHFHGIVGINRYDVKHSTTSLPEAMRWFKAMTANAYLRGIQQGHWWYSDKKLWQRSYHDHIIRNESDLNRIRKYVQHNPALWEKDTFYVR